MSYGTSSGNPGPSGQVDIQHVQKKLHSLLEHLHWSYVTLWSFNSQSRSLEWTGGHFKGNSPAQSNAEVWSIHLFNAQKTCTFTAGRGSVGVAFAERRNIWMNGPSVHLNAGSEVQARILEQARIETAVYIPSAETVLELGTSESVAEDMHLMNSICDLMWDHILPALGHAQAPPHVSQSPLQSSTYSGSNRSSLVDEKVGFFSVCERIAHDIEEVVKRGNLLNERQCRDLSSKLSQSVENIRAIKVIARGSCRLTFTPFLRILYQSLEKAKLLVSECAEEDWTAVALFQVQNESSFQEILLEVGMCYRCIYQNAMFNTSIQVNLLLNDLQSSSWLVPTSVSAIESDREDLRRRLERLASDLNGVKVFGYFLRKHEAQKQWLARHLLKKFSCTSQECLSSFSNVCKASLWEKEMEPPGTWGNSNFLGAGSGASGVCRTQWLGVPCARKEFHGQASVVTFLKEASILSHLKHPRIVNFLCCGNGEAKGDRFIAMELMEKSLFDLIEDQKGVHFSLPVAVDIIVQIAEGMRYLHDQGVAHRDLKPQNVVVNRLACTHLVDQYYCVKLVDFGMSKTKVEVSKSNTVSCRGVGTTRYRAPEVHPKAHPDGLGKAKWFNVDVYSFAMTCAHVLSLKAPFEDMEQLSELYAHLLEGERPQLPSGLPRAMVDILGKCWDVNPLQRPPFEDICRWLYILRFEMLGGNFMSHLYPNILMRYFFEKDLWAKRNGKAMGNSRMRTPRRNSKMSSSLATGQTSFYTAHTHFS